MTQLNIGVVFVQGEKNGAVYNLNDGEIYSVSAESCSAIGKAISDESLSSEEKEYIDLLNQKGLFCKENVKPYIPHKNPPHLDLCWLEITQLCNCKCIHCYEGCRHSQSDDPMSLKDWISVIDQLADMRVGRVVVIGGEPCAHPKINEILSYTASRINNVTLFTNGTLINQSLKQIIIENKVKLKFSIYGHCASVHDKITQTPGSFDRLMQSISYFNSKGIHIKLAVVIMKENEKYYRDLVRFLDSLRIPYKIDVIREVFDGTQSLHIPDDSGIIQSCKRTKPLFPKISKKRFDNAYYYNTCWSGKIVITENGDVLPCVFERNEVLGNVRKQSVLEIADSEPTLKCWEFTYKDIDMCSGCEFRFACKDCRPLAKVTGSVHNKNPRCTYNVYQGEWL